MSDVRDRLIKVLIDEGVYPPTERGYGHPTADAIADAILDKFDVRESA